MRTKLAGLATAVTLVGSLSGCEKVLGSTHHQAESSVSSPSAELQKPFDSIQNYWKVTRGLGGLSIKLAELPTGGTITCGDETIAGEAAYCSSSNSIIVASQPYEALKAKYVQNGGNPKFFPYEVLGHEYGHAVEGYLNYKPDPTVNPQALELTADCLAGEAGLGLNRSDLVDAKIFYNTIGEKGVDNQHGTASDRYESFGEGQLLMDDVTRGCLVGATSFASGDTIPGL